MTRAGGRRGSAMIEFVLLGIPTLFLTISVAAVAMAMWQYHTLEQCSVSGARYVITHGSDCAGTCNINVGNIITRIAHTGTGLDLANLSVRLRSASFDQTYTPASTYKTNATAFPPAADSSAGNDITVTVSMTIRNPIVMFWPGAGKIAAGAFLVEGNSRQRIIF